MSNVEYPANFTFLAHCQFIQNKHLGAITQLCEEICSQTVLKFYIIFDAFYDILQHHLREQDFCFDFVAIPQSSQIRKRCPAGPRVSTVVIYNIFKIIFLTESLFLWGLYSSVQVPIKQHW